MKKLITRFVVLLLASPVAAYVTPLSPEDLLKAAITDVCRRAFAMVEPNLVFDADRVIVHPSGDAVGSIDGLDEAALSQFSSARALGLDTSRWFGLIDARHARRILAVHYN